MGVGRTPKMPAIEKSPPSPPPDEDEEKDDAETKASAETVKPSSEQRSFLRKTPVLVALGVALVAVLVVLGFLVLGGDSEDSSSAEPPELPEDAVAFVDGVDDGEIDQEELDGAIAQTSAASGAKQPPAPETPEYNAVVVPALSEALLSRWVSGEAAERDIEVTETEIDDELERVVNEQFKSEEDFQKFLAEAELTEEEALERVELQLLSQCIQDQVVPQDPDNPTTTPESGCESDVEEIEITDEEIETFYDENSEQFEIEGETQPLDEATSAQIRQQLVSQEQQEAVTEFQDEFNEKWRERTVCSDELIADDADGALEAQLAERCSNFELPEEPEAEDPTVPPGTEPPGTEPPETSEDLERQEKPAIDATGGSPPKELEVEDLETGEGAEAASGDQLTVDYVGVLFKNGEEFDESYSQPEPFTFTLGEGGVIRGWDEGLEGMQVGGRRQLTIPPDLAYGAQGSPPDIPPDATLVFVIDLLAIE